MSEQNQYKLLNEDFSFLLTKNKDKEAIIVLQLIIEKLPHGEDDVVMLNELVEKIERIQLKEIAHENL